MVRVSVRVSVRVRTYDLVDQRLLKDVHTFTHLHVVLNFIPNLTLNI